MAALQKSRPVFIGRPNFYWLAGLGLAFGLGMAVANGFATQQALNAAWGSCHWQMQEHIAHDQQLLQNTRPSQ